jgi:RNA polymerase sigma factor (TIGR02999 family)
VGNDEASREVSHILRAAGEGDTERLGALLPLVYDNLRAIAARRMREERASHTLQPTALVHEAWLRLVGQREMPWSSKAHFYGAAAEAMRRILIDHARGKGRLKRRRDGQRIPLDVVELASREDLDEILSVDEAVRRLEEQDERMAAVVKLRFYAGLSEKEAAEALGITDRTVRREWTLARAWLQDELSGG